jgi:hypothetical protein
MNWAFYPKAADTFARIIEDMRSRGRDPLKLKESFKKALRPILDFPGVGRIIPEFSGSPYREFRVEQYRFFYVVEKQTLWILDVVPQWEEPVEPWPPAAVERLPGTDSARDWSD